MANLLLKFAGWTIKWCAMITQMRKISNVGTRKLVMQVQITQIVWKEGQ